MPVSLLRRPSFWLTIQPLLLLAAMTAAGGMTARVEPDTASYRRVDISSWRTAVAGPRTLGYPVFLRAVGMVSPSSAAVPYVQFLLHAGATALVYFGLRRYGFSLTPALAAASTLYYSGFFLSYTSVLLPDAPALSLAVAAVACLAAIVGNGGAAAWVGFIVLAALAYHFKPAYLVLVPLAPVLSVLLLWLKPRQEGRTRWLRLGGGLTVATGAPLAMFCGLLWATTGQFGLVAFGGFNVLGIAGQMLTPELADEMPPQLRPLAHAILRKERELPEWKPPSGYYDLFDNYDVMIYHVALPAARELYGDDQALANERLGALARRIILARPAAYVRWLLPAAKHGVTQLFEYSFLDRPGLALLPAILLCQAVLIERRRRGLAPPALVRGSDWFVEYNATLLIALSFAGAKLMLVILVERPIYRYVAPAALFLPMWLAVALVDRINRLVAGRTRRGRASS
jgi:hypothetical protein